MINWQKRNRWLLLLTLAVVVAAGACQMPYDSDTMGNNNAGGLDFTTYAGLHIYGELTKDDNKPVRAPLDLALLQVGFFTSCFDDVINNGDDPNLTTACSEYILYKNKTDLTADEQCLQHICLQQTYLCLGYRNLELAASRGIYELETEIFDYEAQLDDSGVIYFSINSPDGGKGAPPSAGALPLSAPRIQNESSPVTFTYRIPPLAVRNRTLALLAAQAAFREAGIQSSLAVDVSKCVSMLATDHKSKSALPSLMDHYTTGFAEASQMLGESVTLLSDNEVNVGTAAMSTETRVDAQKQQWEGRANSRYSAMIRMLGTGMGMSGQEQDDLVVGCPTPNDEQITAKAIAMLRQVALPAVFDSSIGGHDLMILALDVLYDDPGTPPPPSVEDFLGRDAITMGDIAIARQYLLDERRALGRIPTVEDGRLVGGIARPKFQHPGAFYAGKLGGRSGLSIDDGPEYARLGAVQALDYFRHQADRLLAATMNGTGDNLEGLDISGDHQRVISTVSLLGQQLAGSKRVRIEFLKEGEQLSKAVTVTVQGAGVDERVLLVQSERGYRCLAEGTIDSAPCDLSDYIKAHSANRIVPGSADYISPMDPYIAATLEFQDLEPIPNSPDSEKSGIEIYVFLANVSGHTQPALLGSFAIPTEKAASEPPPTNIPAMGVLVDTVPKTYMEREPDSCGTAVNMCGDLNIRRDIIPPLENELTEDSDPYENSWKHYLDLADSAAQEADRLGEEMIRFGLDMDLRAEKVQTELEDLCGVSITDIPDFPTGEVCDPSEPGAECTVIDEFIENNPELAHCLSIDNGGAMQREDFVTLGSAPVCIYKWQMTGRVCACSVVEEAAHRCRRECPLVVPKHLQPADWPATPITKEICADAYAELDDHVLSWTSFTSALGTENADLVPVNNTLSMFQNHANEYQGFNCKKLQDFRQLIDSEPDIDSAKDGYKELMDSQGWWINPEYVSVLSRGIELDTDFYYHYSVRLGGRTVWTTKATDADDCPLDSPWLPEDGPSGGNTNPRIKCYNPIPGTNSQQDWVHWLEQEFIDDGQNVGYALQRRAWGLKMRTMLMQLGVLTGQVNNVVVSRSKYMSSVPTIINEQYTGLPVKENLDADDCKGETCRCLLPITTQPDTVVINSILSGFQGRPGFDPRVLVEPDLTPCGTDLRYDCRVDMKTEDHQIPILNELWNLDLFNFMTSWRFRPHRPILPLWSLTGNGGSACGLGTEIRTNRIDCDYWFPPAQAVCLGIDAIVDDEAAWDDFRVPMSGNTLLDLLDLSCAMASTRQQACADMDPTAVPNITRVEDLDALRAYVVCAANSVHRMSGAIVVPNLPQTLIEGLKRSGFEGQYPGLKGEVLDTVIGIETALRQFSNASDQVRSIMVSVAQDLENVKLAVEIIGVQKKINQLQTLRNVVATATSAISSAVSTRGASLATLATIPIDLELGDLKDTLTDLEEERALHDAVKGIYNSLDQLRDTLESVASSYQRIQTGLSSLDTAQRKAAGYLADLHFLDAGATDSVRTVNTVMRRWLNTLRARYKKASRRARRLAFLARRAIEFRLGVDLQQLDHEMTLVPSPSSWADRVCTMQGFDYEKLRDPDSDLSDPDDPLLQLDPDYQNQDDFRYWYIGDYVTLLRDFVESYSIDFPFSDENDVAVISVRDDYLKVRRSCQEPSRNLLYYTGMPGHGHPIYDDNNNSLGYRGWKDGGCITDPVQNLLEQGPTDRCRQKDLSDPASAVQCDSDFCFGEDHTLYSFTDPEKQLPPGKATRLSDRPFPSEGRPANVIDPTNTGYLSQTVESVEPGDYVLTWWNRASDPSNVVNYRVEVWEVGDATAPIHWAPFTPDATFVRRELRFNVGQVMDLEVRFHPSDDDDIAGPGAAFGDLWLWGTQLERIDPWRCRNFEDPSDCANVPALAYDEVGRDRLIWKPVCADHDGSQMRRKFHRDCVCPDREGGKCPDTVGLANKQCYWYLPMEFPLDQLESGALIPSNNIAARNINYRLDEVAVNLVGTNVRNCEQSQTPSTCATNAFVPYSLSHYGQADVSAYDTQMSYDLPMARIESGKALAAEIVVTNPLTSNHSQLLGSYFKSGLRGRPLTGSYMLRIWETPELDWSRVEDIQLVLRYRYWTRSDQAN